MYNDREKEAIVRAHADISCPGDVTTINMWWQNRLPKGQKRQIQKRPLPKTKKA